MFFERKEIIKILKDNIRLAKSYFKQEHSEEFISETKGLIEGYEFALALLQMKS